jgi:hypothetical protein
MSFGRNPYAAKAEAAELKAAEAADDIARTRAYREAAHEWDRAAQREKPGKRRDEYVQNAERNRALADGAGEGAIPEEETSPTAPIDRARLN